MSIPSESVKESTGKPHLPWIDWLRFLASFLVLAVHARGSVLVDYGSLPVEQRQPLVTVAFVLTRMGREAVLMFFVLSGFLVGGPLIDRVVNGSFRAADYWIDRISRIFVPLVPALLFTAVAALLTGQPAGPGLFAVNLLAMQGLLAGQYGGNDPLWTLTYEVWFYILAGILAWMTCSRRWTPVAVVLLVSGFSVFSYLFVSFLFCWLIGALAGRTRPVKTAKTAMAASLVLIATGVVCTQTNRESQMELASGIRKWVPDQQIIRLILATGFALGIQQLRLWTPRNPTLACLERWGTVLAASSYTLYLTHYPILMLLAAYVRPRAARIDAACIMMFAGSIATCMAAAWLSYFFFESRTAGVRRWARSHMARFSKK